MVERLRNVNWLGLARIEAYSKGALVLQANRAAADTMK